MSKETALNTARKLVEEAVEVAHQAGIDPTTVMAPYCPQGAAAGAPAASGTERSADHQKGLWGSTPVVIDDATTELFGMPAPNADPDQKPEFRVTQSTADLVEEDFGRYQPSLERMVENWQEEKDRLMREQKANDQDKGVREENG